MPRYTPNWFLPVKEPIIGNCYHINGWKFKCNFRVVKIEGDYVYLDNPINIRDKLLKMPKSQLRYLKPDAMYILFWEFVKAFGFRFILLLFMKYENN